jgi:hypothetical protein
VSASLICEAIRTHSMVEFDYHGQHRIVEPYAHGVSTRGVEVMRGIQIRGASSSGGYGFGKLWVVSELEGFRLCDRHFVPNDRHYNPDDRGMQQIHCRIEKGEEEKEKEKK